MPKRKKAKKVSPKTKGSSKQMKLDFEIVGKKRKQEDIQLKTNESSKSIKNSKKIKSKEPEITIEPIVQKEQKTNLNQNEPLQNSSEEQKSTNQIPSSIQSTDAKSINTTTVTHSEKMEAETQKPNEEKKLDETDSKNNDNTTAKETPVVKSPDENINKTESEEVECPICLQKFENTRILGVHIDDWHNSQTVVVSVDEKKELFKASIVLSAVGDAMGYKNGHWEFCYDGNKILNEVAELGGVMNLHIEPTKFRIATAKALLSNWNDDKNLSREEKLKAFNLNFSLKIQLLYNALSKEYVDCFKDMHGRSPGEQCLKALPFLKAGKWDKVPFSKAGGGCGASMRTACIGLYFNKPEQLQDLIEVSIESSRMTHNQPTGFFGGVCSALFTAYSIQKIPIEKWPFLLIKEVIPKCIEYLQTSSRDINSYEKDNALDYFGSQWKSYMRDRGIGRGKGPVKFPQEWTDIDEREEYYKGISWSGWAGSSGHDSVIIAYDALLFSEGNWEKFCTHGCFHGGDSDSTGAIGASWFGALYGMKGVPENHFKDLEKREELEKLAIGIYEKIISQ